VHACALQGLSIACSTPEALAWDPDWADTHEISGRAMRAVHEAGQGFSYQKRQEASHAAGSAQPAANGPLPSSSNSCSREAHDGGLPNGVIKLQVAPLQHEAPVQKQKQQQQQQQQAAAPLKRGVVDAAKANGIHVSAG
jgi:asparagine synthase (glutamine-hydrolysing)